MYWEPELVLNVTNPLQFVGELENIILLVSKYKRQSGKLSHHFIPDSLGKICKL